MSEIYSPKHYNEHPSGIECIRIVEHFSFNIGNAIKYLWRASHKGAELTDLLKAKWYIEREVQRLEIEHDEQERAANLLHNTSQAKERTR